MNTKRRRKRKRYCLQMKMLLEIIKEEGGEEIVSVKIMMTRVRETK